MEIKILTNFTKNGCLFTQLKRTGNVALWLRQTPHGPSYEVIIIRITKKDFVIKGVVVTPAGTELYPSNEQFGSLGWYYPSLDKAEKKYKELLIDQSENGGDYANNPV